MVKQLLVILKIIILTHAACNISSSIPQLSLLPVKFVNINLNSTFQDFTVNANNASASSYAIAITQMDSSSSFEWNLTIRSTTPSLIVSFQNVFVNWIKISCIILASTRNDLTLGSAFIHRSKAQTLNNEMVSINRSIVNYDSSLVIVYLNGYKMPSNSSNQPIGLRLKPFNLSNCSFMVNITTLNSTQLSTIVISFVIFSPINAGFSIFGEEITIKIQQQTQFSDVSQQIPNTPYKFYGISGIKINNPLNFNFFAGIDQNFILNLTSKIDGQITLPYLYFLPSVYQCPQNCDGLILFNNNCIKTCPEGTILITNGQIAFCSKCSENLFLIADRNQTSCICRDDFTMNILGKCISKIIQTNNTLNLTLNGSKQLSNIQTSQNNSTLQGLNISLINNSNTKNQSIANTSLNTVENNSNDSNSSKLQPNKVGVVIVQSNSTIRPTNQTQDIKKTNNTLPNQQNISKNQSAQVNCSKIANSIQVNNKCLCKLGYVSLSAACIPIVTLGNPYNQSGSPSNNNQKISPSASTTLTITSSNIASIKATPVCLQNQFYSISINKCVCNAGYRMNLTKCINICSSIETFNQATNSCICNPGYGRINSQCILCPSINQYSLGNQICYPLLTKQYCRNNYMLQNGICVSCFGINISSKNNGTCSACQNGFIYNGSQCICPYQNQIINQTCISPTCGNNKKDSSQTCDDGNIVNGDGCSSYCLIQSGYYCSNLSLCNKSVCGNGVITGGEQCDDNNTINGDGCSSLCLVQANYTCVGPLSSCFKIQTGNISVVSINTNTNKIFIIFQTPKSYNFPNSAFMQTFLNFKFMTKNFTPGIVYCQQQIISLNRFDCLLIFPRGVPIIDFIMNFNYNYNNSTGSILVYFAKGGNMQIN